MVFLILLLSSRISLATAFRKTKATLRGGELKVIYSSLELVLCRVCGQHGLSGRNVPPIELTHSSPCCYSFSLILWLVLPASWAFLGDRVW